MDLVRGRIGQPLRVLSSDQGGALPGSVEPVAGGAEPVHLRGLFIAHHDGLVSPGPELLPPADQAPQLPGQPPPARAEEGPARAEEDPAWAEEGPARAKEDHCAASNQGESRR